MEKMLSQMQSPLMTSEANGGNAHQVQSHTKTVPRCTFPNFVVSIMLFFFLHGLCSRLNTFIMLCHHNNEEIVSLTNEKKKLSKNLSILL